MSSPKLFWGLHIETGKAYAQTVNQGFAIKQAVVEKLENSPTKSGKGPGDGPVQVFAKYDNADFLLCILSTKQVETSQAQLNVRFETGAQLTLRVIGPPNHQVHLTGYCIPSSKLTSTPNTSTITIPFEGQQKSILVSSKKSETTEKKPKKRVSIEDIVGVTTGKKASLKDKGNKSHSFDEDDEDEDMNFIKNGLNPVGDDEDDDDDDDDDSDNIFEIEGDSDEDTEENRAAYLKLLNQKLESETKQKGKKNQDLVDDEDDDDDDDDDEDDDDIEVDEDDDDDDDDDDEEDDDDDDDEEVEEKTTAEKKNSQPSTPQSSKIPVLNGSPSGSKSDSKKIGKKTPSENELKTPENQKLQALKAPSSAGHTPMKTITKGGVMLQELKVGTGPIAKGGKMVAVYYQGRLKTNNKLFDKNTSGNGFKFRLGKGEVIKGWDIGVEGMKVGGKRKIIIPPNFAYGKKGAAPDIPPNSTLVFEVELKGVH